MKDFRLKITFALLLSLPGQALAAPDWLDLIAKGKNRAAAAELEKLADRLQKNSSPDYVDLIRVTAKSIATGCEECAERDKTILFRGITQGVSDKKITSRMIALFPAKALKDRSHNYNSDGIKFHAKSGIRRLTGQHAGGTNGSGSNSKGSIKGSPFLSTSVSSWVAGGNAVIVIKICPQRVILNTSSTYEQEREALIPFFIHPNEVVAVVDKSSENALVDGKFQFLYRGKELEGKSDDEATRLIKSWAKKNEAFIDANELSFGHRYEKQLKTKLQGSYSAMDVAKGVYPDPFESLVSIEDIKATYLRLKKDRELGQLQGYLLNALKKKKYDGFDTKQVDEIFVFLTEEIENKYLLGKLLKTRWNALSEQTKNKILKNAIKGSDNLLLRILTSDCMPQESDFARSTELIHQIVEMRNEVVNRSLAEHIFGNRKAKGLEEELVHLIRNSGQNSLGLMRDLSEHVFSKKHTFAMRNAAIEFQKKFAKLSPELQETFAKYFENNPLLAQNSNPVANCIKASLKLSK